MFSALKLPHNPDNKMKDCELLRIDSKRLIFERISLATCPCGNMSSSSNLLNIQTKYPGKSIISYRCGGELFVVNESHKIANYNISTIDAPEFAIHLNMPKNELTFVYNAHNT